MYVLTRYCSLIHKKHFCKKKYLKNLVLLFLQKRFLCVKLQYLVSTNLQLDYLYLEKQIYSETFCYPTPMSVRSQVLTKV